MCALVRLHPTAWTSARVVAMPDSRPWSYLKEPCRAAHFANPTRPCLVDLTWLFHRVSKSEPSYMIVNLGCHLDWIWMPATPVRYCLDHISWPGKTHPQHVWHLLGAVQIKQHGRKTLFSLPVFLHSVGKFIHSVVAAAIFFRWC